MKEITVISGKGGTGKTSITASLAAAGPGLVLCDGDVDAADLHLILGPDVKETHTFEGGWTASIQQEKCSGCNICEEYCRFDAIFRDDNNRLVIDGFKCEGCRLCERLCPSKAIKSKRSNSSRWYVSETRFGILVHAEMGPGEENSGKLVTLVKENARELATRSGAKMILTDGPPGTGCPTIAAVAGADAVLVVIEPSITSMHDAERVIELVRGFGIPVYALLNKSDLNPRISKLVESQLEVYSVPLLGQIPFDEGVVEAMIEGLSFLEYAPDSGASSIIRSVWMQLFSN